MTNEASETVLSWVTSARLRPDKRMLGALSVVRALVHDCVRDYATAVRVIAQCGQVWRRTRSP